MSNIYHDLILEHYKNPRNFGELSNADITIREENIGCGDVVEIFIKKQKILQSRIPLRGTKNKKQIEVKWKGRGCAIMTASASLLTEHVIHHSVFSIQNLTDHDMVALLGGEISPSRMNCATLALKALRKAFEKIS